MSIVDGQGLITWEGGLFEPGSDLLRRVQWAFAQIRAAGGHISLNEAGRPFGVPGDKNVRSASQTESGLSTVWFQWGRYLRGETPSAANPAGGVYASQHTKGIAVDCNAPTAFDMTLRARFFGMVGMAQTVPSESWHWAIVRPSSVDVSAYGNSTQSKEDDTMSAQDVADLKSFITDKLTHGNAGLRLIQCTQRGIAVVGAGYFKGLTEEELPYAVSLWGWPEDYADNPRAFDLAVAISLNGVTATDSEIADVQKVIADQAAKADQNAAVIAGLAHLAGN